MDENNIFCYVSQFIFFLFYFLFLGGTHSIENWLENIDFTELHISPWSHKNVPGMVHEGFYNDWMAMREFIKNILSTQSCHTIHFVGHSLGGAGKKKNTEK
jgi:predicted lipase